MKWLSLLQHVPWSDVIHNAPKVVDSAKKLWDTTLNKGETPAPAPTAVPTAEPPSPQALATLQARSEALEQAVLSLREQMQTSSALVKTLAEQNTQLIARVQGQGQQLRRLTAGLLALGLLAAAALAWLAQR